jgi:thiol-disulfide isomerase/thioredoxin
MSMIARRMFMVLSVAAFWAALLVSPVSANAAPLQPGGPLPDFKLPIPEHSADREYLGLTTSGPFTIAQIKAQVVIIEILSMYCPYCQREAPEVNRLYEIIENNADLKSRIKLIGTRFPFRSSRMRTLSSTKPSGRSGPPFLSVSG